MIDEAAQIVLVWLAAFAVMAGLLAFVFRIVPRGQLLPIVLRYEPDIRLPKPAFAGLYLLGALGVACGVNFIPTRQSPGLGFNVFAATMPVFMLFANALFIRFARLGVRRQKPRPIGMGDQ